VPPGDDWLHEVKFDGYRVQVHKMGREVCIFSRNGHDFTARYLPIALMLSELPSWMQNSSPAMPEVCRTSARCIASVLPAAI
jgi:bifunctional non-homologous end joining protein LigD